MTHCRPSGNQGATGRPATALDALLSLSAKDQAFSLASLARDLSPREGFFTRLSISAKDQTLSPMGLERDSSLRRASPAQKTTKSWRVSAPPSRGVRYYKTSARLQVLAGFLQVEASSCAAAERTWALRPPQSDARACA